MLDLFACLGNIWEGTFYYVMMLRDNIAEKI